MILIGLILLLLLGSALFSSMETALFSISRTKLKALRQLKRRGVRSIAYLKSRPDLLLVVLLTGNLIVNVTAAALATLFVIGLFSASNEVLVIESFVMSILLLIIGEITPKVIARRNYESFALRVSPYFRFIYLAFLPVSIPFYLLVRRLIPSQRFGSLSPEDLRTMVEEAEAKRVVSEYEAVILRQLLTLGMRRVADIMTPRNSIVAIPVANTAGDALRLIRRTRHSRILVYGNNLDNVVGIIYAKDLIRSDPKTPLHQLLREPIFIPETKRLDSLLEEFTEIRCHIGVVVDEYGGVSGLVTLEDVLEAIVGEIVDESDDIEDRDYIALGEDRYLVSGDLDLDVLFNLFGKKRKIEKGKRVSAYIMDLLGSIPVEGEVVHFDHLEAKISKVVGNRIVWLVVRSISS
ncbi:hypothetical protein DRP53_00060 [candidate division WOR-3 bacterium]|uniref:HlyC/CorC family transporter n=1 Tax=candidate division WOR-3 bacterium TaxID=2052148 RepID=A0A660SPC0_UNCW3|nr:MAG: hypothetical protein DRP53_00060 [candidate division WOR-3 bacterium]